MFAEVLKHALMITGFVFTMMLVIEYLSVLSRGRWESAIRGRLWEQSMFGAFLGAIPGCLGAFAAVSLYAHRILTFGALVATMIATCGDETFVMLALFPGESLIIIGVLFVIGAISGIATDVLLKSYTTRQDRFLAKHQAVHLEEERCVCFSVREFVAQWRHCSPQRGLLSSFLLLFALGIWSGEIGESEWNWIRTTLLVAAVLGLLIVSSVPDHFLEEHLWGHLVKVHVWRIFLWTFGALLVVHLLLKHLDIEELISENRLFVLVLACLIGLIPESGPHLIFVTLYAQGLLPFGILLASCIVQDGHGMLPVLAHSRRAFVAVKAVNLVVGLAVGLLCLVLKL